MTKPEAPCPWCYSYRPCAAHRCAHPGCGVRVDGRYADDDRRPVCFTHALARRNPDREPCL